MTQQTKLISNFRSRVVEESEIYIHVKMRSLLVGLVILFDTIAADENITCKSAGDDFIVESIHINVDKKSNILQISANCENVKTKSYTRGNLLIYPGKNFTKPCCFYEEMINQSLQG